MSNARQHASPTTVVRRLRIRFSNICETHTPVSNRRMSYRLQRSTCRDFSDILIRFTQEVDVEKRGAKYHRERLGEALREEIETIVEGELGDPRIGLVSVSGVVLADDSRSAQVFVTLDGDDNEAQRSLEGLTAAVGYIRREVAENL